MKIIRPSTPPEKWVGECRKCHAQIEAEESELTHITHDYREDGKFSWERCPCCHYGDKDSGYGGVLFHPVNP